MKLAPLTGAVALMALSLGGCERGMVNSQICTSFKTGGGAQAAAPASGAFDAASPVDECVRRWAYSLAGSRDGAEVVASAAVAACGATLSRWNQAGLSQGPSAPGDQAVSLTTGEPTNAMAVHNTFAQDRALLYVVQARAGHCAPPPATNGVPAGV